MYEKNEIVVKGKIAEIILYKGRIRKEVARTIIDNDLVDKVKEYKWKLTKYGYVTTDLKGKKRLFLHHLVLLRKQGKLTDHINQNKLDNRKDNLRYGDKQLNAINSKMRMDNTSGLKGVSWSKENKKWHAYLAIDGKRVLNKLFSDINEAKQAREEAENEHYKPLLTN